MGRSLGRRLTDWKMSLHNTRVCVAELLARGVITAEQMAKIFGIIVEADVSLNKLCGFSRTIGTLSPKR
jgi:hypothetical protein